MPATTPPVKLPGAFLDASPSVSLMTVLKDERQYGRHDDALRAISFIIVAMRSSGRRLRDDLYRKHSAASRKAICHNARAIFCHIIDAGFLCRVDFTICRP